MKSRYCTNPAVYGRIGRRVTLIERIRRRFRRAEQPDLFPIVGYFAPIYPGK